MQSTNNYPSASRAGPYARFSRRRREVLYMAKVVKEVPISCRPGWTPDYELIASRIPTLILPSHAIASPCSVPLERSNSSIPRTPTIIVTPPGAPVGRQRIPGRSNEYLFSGSMSEFYSDLSSPENSVGLGIQTPMSVPLSRSASHHHSSSSKRRTSSKPQSSSVKATRSRSSRGSSNRYLQVPSPRRHRSSRLRRSAQVKPLDLTKVKPSFKIVERADGRSPLWMHTNECPPSVTPMLERMVLGD